MLPDSFSPTGHGLDLHIGALYKYLLIFLAISETHRAQYMRRQYTIFFTIVSPLLMRHITPPPKTLIIIITKPCRHRVYATITTAQNKENTLLNNLSPNCTGSWALRSRTHNLHLLLATHQMSRRLQSVVE